MGNLLPSLNVLALPNPGIKQNGPLTTGMHYYIVGVQYKVQLYHSTTGSVMCCLLLGIQGNVDGLS